MYIVARAPVVYILKGLSKQVISCLENGLRSSALGINAQNMGCYLVFIVCELHMNDSAVCHGICDLLSICHLNFLNRGGPTFKHENVKSKWKSQNVFRVLLGSICQKGTGCFRMKQIGIVSYLITKY